MKKQLSLTLAAIMLAGLTACGTSTPAASSEATAPASSESEATAEKCACHSRFVVVTPTKNLLYIRSLYGILVHRDER